MSDVVVQNNVYKAVWMLGLSFRATVSSLRRYLFDVV